MSRGQRALWLLERLAPESGAYRIAAAGRVVAGLDRDALARAIAAVVARHDALRTVFVEIAGEPVRRVLDSMTVPLEEVPAGGWCEAELERRLSEAAHRPFDLERGPLLRVALFRRGPGEDRVVFVVHHLVADLWSLAVVLAELGELLAGRPPEAPAASYEEFVAEQEAYLAGDRGEADWRYWAERLASRPPAVDLPGDRSRPPVQTFRGGARRLRLSAEAWSRLRRLGRSRRASPVVVLLAAFDALLHHYTAQDDLSVGTPTAGRRSGRLSNVVGYCVNPVPVRADLAGDPRFEEVVDRVREAALGAFEHQDLPFPVLVERLERKHGGGRDPSRSPLFQVMLGLQRARLGVDEGMAGFALGVPGAALRLGPLEVESVALDPRGSQFDLTVMTGEVAGELRGTLTYNSDLFDATSVERMARHLERLLEEVARDPGRRLSELSLLAPAERAQLLVEWNDTAPAPRRPATSEDRPATLAAAFRRAAAARPDAVALVAGGRSLSYGALAQRSSRLARRLRALGVGPEARVAVMLRRRAELVVALLGVMEAGGAYVPLDPAYPAERLGFMLADSGAVALVAEDDLVAGLDLDALEPRPALLDPLDPEGRVDGEPAEIGPPSPRRPPAEAGPCNLAYLIYTSGSTGRPKAVAIEHRSALALVRWSEGVFEDRELSGVLAATSICFDLSVFELFVTLLRGGRVFLVENALAFSELAPAAAVTLVNTVPSAMEELARLGWLPPSVETVNLAGEPLRRALVDTIHRRSTVRRVLDLYGPSEDTTYSTGAVCAPPSAPGDEPAGEPAIGRPILGTTAYLTRDLRPVPLGAAGELLLGGAGLARGYLGRPALTAERFVPDPFAGGRGQPGARLYRTGDLARFDRAGDLHYLGRIDHQVKIRGHRVELGEIESLLVRHPAVREAVVVANDAGGKAGARLVAYVTAGAPGDRATEAELRRHLESKLPAPLVPSAFVVLDTLPRTPNGKVDRRALPEPDWSARAVHVAPRTPVEEALAEIFREVLGIERVGVEDGFFELGGHSLLVARMIAAVKDRLGFELSLALVFENPTIATLAATIEAAGDAASSRVPAPRPVPSAAIPRLAGDGPWPLSFAQERLWFLEQLEPGRPTYNMPAAVVLRGRLDAAALARAFGGVVRRHGALRSELGRVAGEPVQRVLPPAPGGLALVDLAGLPSARRQAAARALARSEARRPFDLERGPLLRARLVRLSADEHLFVLNVHHAVCDGWSLGIFVRELAVLYGAALAGLPDPLPRPPIRYGDFAAWQRRYLAGDTVEALLDWWRRELEGLPELSELPLDRPRPAAPTRAGAVHRRALPPELFGAFARLAREHGATLFMALFAAFQALVHRHSGASDLALGTPVAGRGRPETEGVIGLFVDTVVLRSDLEGDPSFLDLLARARRRAAAAFAHQALPFDRLVAELAARRDGAVTPLFQVMLALQNAPLGPLALPGVALEPVPLDSGSAKFDLAASFAEAGGGLEGTWAFAAELLDVTTVARLARRFETLVRGLTGAPERRLSEQPLLSPAEDHQVRLEWPSPSEGYGVPGLLHEMLAARAEVAPDGVALVLEDAYLSLGALRLRWRQVAARLRRAGVGSGDMVALFLDRSFDLVAGLVGVVEAGGAYLPLDPAYPPDRIAFMLEDSGARAVVTQASLASSLPAATEGGPLAIVLDDEESFGGEPAGEPAPAVEVVPDQPAYVIYTSGSTGRPKGVVVSHRSLANRIAFHVAELEPDDRYLARTTISFDVSILQLVAPMLRGGGAVLVPPDLEQDAAALVRLSAQGRVTHLSTPPSLLTQLLVEPEFVRLPSLARVITGGEVVPPAVARAVRAALGVPVVNRYGPTELTISVTSWTCPPEIRETVLPIGRPIARTSIHLLDSSLRPVPIGVTGELLGGGVAVAQGYLGRPAATAAVFVPDPFSSVPGARLYRTGDLARWRGDGQIEFVGRRDEQVKVRGYRIELGEVEAALGRCPAVGEAVVMARPEPSTGTRQLVAYVVPARRGAEPAEVLAAARKVLIERLPAYMVPSSFAVLDALPLTPSGKVDRRALPEPDWHRTEGVPYEAPRTPAEELVASLFASVLGLDGERRQVGLSDHFFELGGHSLLATRLVSRLRESFGVEVPIRALFENPTVGALAAAVEARARGGEETPALVALPREHGAGAAPLAFPPSFAQERLWFLAQLDPESPAYNLPGVVRLGGRLDVPALAAALAGVVARHEALRTVFRPEGAGLVQVVHPPGWEPPARLATVDLSRLAGEGLDVVADDLVRRESARPFDLEAGPLVRCTLLRLARDEHVLVVNTHHVVSDGWSVGVFVRELSALYAARVADAPAAGGGLPDLPELPVQYADFSVWQRAWLDGAALDRIAGWWRDDLAGAPGTLELPTDRPRPPVQTFRGSETRRIYAEPLGSGVTRLARELDATPFMVWLAALGALLGRLAGQDDLVLGSPIAGRNRTETEGLIGFFVNTLALRIDLGGAPSFAELVARVRERALGAYAHQDLPFERLVEAVAPRRDLATTPLFQVLFALQNVPRERIELPGLVIERVPGAAPAAKFDLTIDLSEEPSGEVSGRFELNRDLFDVSTVRRWAGALERIVTTALAEPERRVAELPLLGPAERQQLVHEVNDTCDPGVAGPKEDLATPLHRWIEARAVEVPDRVALVFGDACLSFAELDFRARRLARELRRSGVGPDARVGVAAERSLELVVALVAVLEAGGAYVPFDPSYPPERLEFMLADAGLSCLLVQGRLLARLPEVPAGVPVIDLDARPDPGMDEPAEDLPGDAGPESAAYMIYTSGSTGRPKGAINSHRAIVNRLAWMQRAFGLGPDDRVLQKTPASFDVSVWEFFWPLITGTCLVIARPDGHRDPEYLARTLERERITTLHFVPSMLQAFLSEPDLSGCAGVRRTITSGEALPRDLAERFFERLAAPAQLHNLYGPTEAAVDVTWWPCERDSPWRSIPIGRPIANVTIHILDAGLRPVPLGVPGEVAIGGVNLARGYLRRAGLSAERFVPDPFGGVGGRLYRTGDLGRRLPGGEVEFLGRLDHQVKVRGIRIELGEVEARLLDHPQVREAVVVARRDPGGDMMLVAYVTPASGAPEPAALREHLRRTLPEPMVPAAFVALEALPLNPSGKADRGALAARKDGAAEERGPVTAPPETAVEVALAEMFAEVLGRGGIDGIGIDDDFFDLGGQSLKATQVLLRVQDAFGVRVPVRRFFENPTVGGLAFAVAEQLLESVDLDPETAALLAG